MILIVEGVVYSRICERVLDTDGCTALLFKKTVSETDARAYPVTETVRANQNQILLNCEEISE